ncbi:MAG: hypothetical protein HY591_00400 [Candidatus Omnitrophica bacterium]|nr:hypothetical protein [Candidatus Omnitrophota bacterium]
MAETLLNQQEQKIDQVMDGQNQNTFLKRTVGLILAVVMIALTAYVINLQNQNNRTLSHTNELFASSSSHQASNYRSYVKQYKDTKEQLEETTRKLEMVQKELDQASAELATTKGMLTETQGMLAQAQAENAKLKQEVQDLEVLRGAENVKTVPELEARINSLKQKNVEVSSELTNVKNELRAFEAEFSDTREGKSLIVLFQNKIKLVKSRMRYLKQEAYFAKVAAQKEKDRVAAMNGNSGYLVRGGQPNKSGNAKGFAIDVKMVQ